jgi:drug/metabolite transporter (DMT)-like permease
MILITLGGMVLSWERSPTFTVPVGPLAVVGACLCWAVDNNLTRKISAKEPVLIAGSKGFVAGLINLGLAHAVGIRSQVSGQPSSPAWWAYYRLWD